MKYIFILLIILCALQARAQTSKSTQKSINDDGKTLQLKYEVLSEGASVRNSRSFDVQGWSEKQKDDLVKHITDSLENKSGNDSNYLHKRIDDNGETMNVSVEGRLKGKTISFNKDFQVKGMTEAQKSTIVENVMTSLGVAEKKKE
jgi:hypothetical protein